MNPPSGRTSVALVARREIRERLRTKSFRWATAFLLTASVVGVALPTLVGSDNKTAQVRVGATANVPADIRQTIGRLETGSDPDERTETVVVTYDTEARGRAAVLDDDVAFLVTPDRLLAGEDVSTDGSGAPAQVFAAAGELLRLQAGLERVGVQDDDVVRALSAQPLPVVRLTPKADATNEDQIPFVGTANVLMYLVLIFYGQAVAAGVNEEKSSRVVELLLSAMSPRRLLTGKVVGIGLVGLLQVALLAVTAGATALVVGTDLPSGSTGTAAAYVVWFALAYALYCTLFAAAGSLTSRAEESQQAATPVYLLLAIGYLAAFSAFQSPNGTLVTVLSFVPFSAPMVMPARAAIGSVSWIAIAVSMLLTVVTTVVIIRIAGRIYAGALLRFGPRVKLLDAFRAEVSGRDEPGPPADQQPVTPQPSGSSVG